MPYGLKQMPATVNQVLAKQDSLAAQPDRAPSKELGKLFLILAKVLLLLLSPSLSPFSFLLCFSFFYYCQLFQEMYTLSP